MNKKVLIGAVAGLGAAACIAACAKSGKCQSDSEPNPTVDKVEATKANTDEIPTLSKDEALATTPAQ